MNYAILFFLIGLNFILVYMIPKKEQDSVKRTIKEFNYNIYIREYKTLNIFFLLFNIAFIALDIMYEKSFIADLILTVVHLISFVLLMMNIKEKKSNYHIMTRRTNRLIPMIRNSLILILVTTKIISIEELYNLGFLIIICSIFVVINIIRLLGFFKDNKDITKYRTVKSDYLTDIKGTLYLEKGSIFKYLGVGVAIILILYVKIRFAYIAYALISILVYLIYNMRLNHLKKEYKKLQTNLYDMNLRPGPLYIYQFKKEVINTNNMIIYLILFIIASITSYLVGEIEYILIGFDIYLIALYTLLEAKKKHIRYTFALNKELINKDKYSIDLNNLITDVIDYKEPFVNLKLYKLIYVDNDNNVYTSEIELYNIKEVFDNINIMIDSKNMYNYIVMDEEYY